MRPKSVPHHHPAPARILRIGILLGDTLVEERLVHHRVPVSIGQRTRNTFSVPVEALPRTFTMFAVDQGRYYLRFSAGMAGRIKDGASDQTLAELAAATPESNGYRQIALGETARGKVVLADLTILFQFVTEPPRAPAPKLPASLRGRISDRIDPRLTSILIVSLVIHVGFACYSLVADADTDEPLVELAPPSTFHQQVIELDVADLPPEPGATSTQVVAVVTPRPSAPSRGHEPGRAPPVARNDVDARAFADAMTGEGPNGHAADDAASRRPPADLDAQVALARESHRHVDIGDTSGRGFRPGDARVGNGQGPVLDTPGGFDPIARRDESGPSVRVLPGDPPTGDRTTLTPDAVLSRVMGMYLSQLQRCYRDYLKTDASARGRVTLAFTVNTSGRVVSAQASGVAQLVDTCIQTRMSAWTFEVPRAKRGGDATEASFDITLQLLPE
jgi:hypothetical protein